MIETTAFKVELSQPATDMVQEELRKQIAFLSPGISNIRFENDGRAVTFEVSEGNAPPDDLEAQVKALAARIQRGLRQSQRKVIFVSPRMQNPTFDPVDGSLFVTRSGARGENVPVSIFRIGPEGKVEEFSGDITNPTSIAFDRSGRRNCNCFPGCMGWALASLPSRD